jgi:Zn-dependent peptidase ImmA (M78 family)
MRHYRTPGSILTERTYFSRPEIEKMADDELRTADCRPQQPEPIALEKYLRRRHDGLEPIITELDPGLMGSADFTNPRQPVIKIATHVFNGPVPRYRSTVAHEIGHLVLHASLFLDVQFLRALEHLRRHSLHRGFECTPTDIDETPRQRVNKADPLFHLEYQANLFMLAMLLPKPLVRACVASHTQTTSLRGGGREIILPDTHRQEAIHHVAQTFTVSRTMATFRLEELYGAPVAAQPQQPVQFSFNFSASTDSPSQAWTGTDGSCGERHKEVLWTQP